MGSKPSWDCAAVERAFHRHSRPLAVIGARAHITNAFPKAAIESMLEANEFDTGVRPRHVFLGSNIVTAITHSHDDAIKGAQAVAAAIWFARTGLPKDAVRGEIEDRFGYQLNHTIDSIREGYTFDVSTAGTVPPALTAAFEADDLEGAIRLAVSLGGDADTLACIAGGVAEALYGVPDDLWRSVEMRLPRSFLEFIEQMYASRRIG